MTCIPLRVVLPLVAICLVGVGLVAKDLFASALGDEIDFAWEGGYGLGEILPEEDAAGLEPLELERECVLKDGWCVGEERSVPEV